MIYSKNMLKEFYKDSILFKFDDDVNVRIAKSLEENYKSGCYNDFLIKMSNYYKMIKTLKIEFPSNSNPKFYIYIVPDKNFEKYLNIPSSFAGKKGGGKPVPSLDIDGFKEAYGTSQNLCINKTDISIQTEVNLIHEITHLFHHEFFSQSQILQEGFAECIPLYILDYEDKFIKHKDLLESISEDDILTVDQMIIEEKNNMFGCNSLSDNNNGCTFRQSYISSYLFVRGYIKKLENKYKLNKNEALHLFLENVKFSSLLYSQHWLFNSLADEIDYDYSDILFSKNIQLEALHDIKNKR